VKLQNFIKLLVPFYRHQTAHCFKIIAISMKMDQVTLVVPTETFVFTGSRSIISGCPVVDFGIEFPNVVLVNSASEPATTFTGAT
jgi:hypothetical protein